MEIELEMREIVNAMPAMDNIFMGETKGLLPFHLGRILLKIRPEVENYHTQRNKLLEELCKKDEKGKIVEDENKHVVWKDNESKVKYFEENQKLLETKIKINIDKIKMDLLQDVKLSNGVNALLLLPFIE